MQALTLPASRGIRWFYEGYRIFSKNRMMLALVVMGYWMSVGLINALPVVGQIVTALCIPAFSVSLMNACRLIERGELLTPAVLLSGFKDNLRTLIILGALYLVVALAILGLSALIDDGALFQYFVSGKSPGDDETVRREMMMASQVALVFFIPVMMAYWYAPLLAAWHGLSPAKALFFSFVACLRNWRAFLLYGLTVMIAGVLIPGFVLGVMGSLFSDARLFTVALTLIVVLVLAPTLYASFYVSYRDVFVAIDEDV